MSAETDARGKRLLDIWRSKRAIGWPYLRNTGRFECADEHPSDPSLWWTDLETPVDHTLDFKRLVFTLERGIFDFNGKIYWRVMCEGYVMEYFE